MKKLYFLLLILILQACTPATLDNITPYTMKMTSPSFSDGEEMPSEFTCDSEDVNPKLNIVEVPDATKSLALIVDDPDAPGGTWVHWVVWNIEASTTKIERNSVPQGAIQGLNDSKINKWSGPCPPSGAHRYYFKLYALDQAPTLSSNSSKKDLEKAMEGHILDQATLMGTYSRK